MTWSFHFSSDTNLKGPSDYKVELEIQNGSGKDLHLDVEIRLRDPSGNIASIQQGIFPTKSEWISSAGLSGSIDQPTVLQAWKAGLLY